MISYEYKKYRKIMVSLIGRHLEKAVADDSPIVCP